MQNFDSIIGKMQIDIDEMSFNEEAEEAYIQQVVEIERKKTDSVQEENEPEQPKNGNNLDLKVIATKAEDSSSGFTKTVQESIVEEKMEIVIDTEKPEDQFFKEYV